MQPRSWLALVALCALGPLACTTGRGGGYYYPDDDAGDDAESDADPGDAKPADVPPACDPPRAICNGLCVDPLTDVRNCGGCGRLCPSGQPCADGSCMGPAPTCAAPRALCGTACVDTLSDVANCGACGRACPSGQTCSDGACRAPGPTCAAPQVLCAGRCVNTQSDTANCGGCGRACATSQVCTAGVCATSLPGCAAPRMLCGSTCTDVDTDVNNCGFCGIRCGAGQTCTTGLCFGGSTCAAPRVMCPSGCTDVQSDAANCGACSRACAAGQTCSFGVCQSTTGGTSRAGAACTTPGSDPTCGSLMCLNTGALPVCSGPCTNSPSQSQEQSMCGGAGSTCLTQGDGATASSNCLAACRPSGTTTATGACRAGLVCTGWWFTHAGATPDATGCFPFCSNNTHCTAGTLCNARSGDCNTTGVVATRLADGSPCNPTITAMVPGSTTPQNIQCRGLCFAVSSDRTQGICGSFLNTVVGTSCPDTPTLISPLAPPGADNLALCIFKDCVRNSGCTLPLVCRYDEDASGTPDTTSQPNCQYPTTRQRTGIP